MLSNLLLLFYSCSKKNVVNSKQLPNANTPTLNTTNIPVAISGVYPSACPMGNGTKTGIADAGQVLDYFKINNPTIIAHGSRTSSVAWSSALNLPVGYSQSMFMTNSRFNVRVIPRRTTASVDSMGVACKFQSPPSPFTKMQIGITVRKSGAVTGDYFVFDNVDVNCSSGVHAFNVPVGTTLPLVVEVSNVKWDWSCKSYALQGFPNMPSYCPWDSFWPNDCYSLEIQFSTDTTKDLPGPKI